MKEERFTGRAILAVAASYALWLFIGFLGALLVQLALGICLANIHSIGNAFVGIIIFLGYAFTIFVVYIKYKLAKYTMQRICQTIPTTIFAFRIFGWFLITIGAVNMIISAAYDDPSVPWEFLFGYFFLRNAKNMKQTDIP